jgi:hypothetical protein
VRAPGLIFGFNKGVAMSKARLVLSLGILVLVTSAFVVEQAARVNDVSGRWNVQVNAQGQAMASSLVLQQDGDSITGRFQSDLGETPVRGSVRGDTVFFGMSLNMGGQALDVWGRGVLQNEDEMRGQLDVMGGMASLPFTARRAR